MSAVKCPNRRIVTSPPPHRILRRWRKKREEDGFNRTFHRSCCFGHKLGETYSKVGIRFTYMPQNCLPIGIFLSLWKGHTLSCIALYTVSRKRGDILQMRSHFPEKSQRNVGKGVTSLRTSKTPRVDCLEAGLNPPWVEPF